MNSTDFYNSLSKPEESVQDSFDAMKFFVGLKKEANGPKASIFTHKDGYFTVSHGGQDHHVHRDVVVKRFPELANVHDQTFGKGNWGPNQGIKKEANPAFEILKTLVKQKIPSKDYLVPALLGAAAAGGLAANKYIGRKFLGGNSIFQRDSENAAKSQKVDGVDESKLSLVAKLKRRDVEARPGIAKAFREHPIQSSLKAALAGGAAGMGLWSQVKNIKNVANAVKAAI